MSELKIFIGACIPDPKSEADDGARKVAIAFEAKDLKHAKAKLAFMFVEEYPGVGDAAYKHLVCEDAPGMPRPAIGKWDENFLYEYEWDEVVGHPVAKEPELVNFDALPTATKIAVLVKFKKTDITKDELPDALALLQDDTGTFQGHIVEAIIKTPEIASMYPGHILAAIMFIVEKCPTVKKWPEIKAALGKWQKGLKENREETLRTDPGATAGGGNATDRNPDLNHNFDTLALEVALGILARAIDFDIYNISGSILNRAKDIVKQKERPFPQFFGALRQAPGILDYSRAMIIYAVKTAPANIEHTPGALLTYLNKTLTETDHAYPDPHMVAVACGTQEIATETPETVEPQTENEPQEIATEGERKGPFYYLTTSGSIGRANKQKGLEAALADGAKEITHEEYQARKNGSRDQAEPEPDQNQPQADPSEPETDQSEPESPASMPEKHTFVPAASFQSVGESLEKEMQHKPAEALDNLGIWKQVMRTDPRFTKSLDGAGTGYGGTSINGEYMAMRATEVFGPVGMNWGVEVLEDRLIDGAPLTEKIYEGSKIVGSKILRDGDGTLLFEKHHSIKIDFWYRNDQAQGHVIAYGATPYLYATKHGIKSDGEAQKKSLTDAMKKALSLLGFSADIYLGLYDNAEYALANSTEFAIRNASEKAEDVTRLRSELDEKLTRVAATIEKTVSVNEAKKVFETIAREAEIHRKTAESGGDAEWSNYLAGRLRRLLKIKDARVAALTAEKAQ